MGKIEEFEKDLIALAALRDEEIDTSEIPETESFEGAERGRYSDIAVRGYDVRSIANWCLVRARRERVEASNLWLNKLVYFIYERALVELKALLTPARLEAWDFGPVFRELYGAFPKNPKTDLYTKFNVLKRQREEAYEPFEVADLELFDRVWNELGHKTASQLTKISHKEGSPWYRIWRYKGEANPGMVIDIQTILDRPVDQMNGNS